MKKIIFYSCCVALIFSISGIGLDVACADEIPNISNSDIDVVLLTNKLFGNLIGDIILLDIIVFHKTKGLIIDSQRIPAKGSWGDFEIVELSTDEKRGKSIFTYKLQAFISPNKSFRLSTGSIELFYTADKYWSIEDQKYVYHTLTTRPFNIYQSSLDPRNSIPLSYEFKFLSWHSSLGYGFIFLGLIALFFTFYRQLRLVYTRVFKRKEENRTFLNRIIKDDLSVYDHAAISKRLNSIEKNDLLIQVLYGGYEPKDDEIKQIAQNMLCRLDKGE